MKTTCHDVSEVAAGAFTEATISDSSQEIPAENVPLSFRISHSPVHRLLKLIGWAVLLILLRSEFKISFMWRFGSPANHSSEEAEVKSCISCGASGHEIRSHQA